MAATLDIPQTVSPVDALWTIFMSQTKAVKKEFTKRLSTLEGQQKAKMTEKEFYAKIDKSLATADKEPVYTMGNNETGMDFINRMLSQSE